MTQKVGSYKSSNAEGASSQVAQAFAFFFPALSETADELKDIYLVTSAHSHVNNKDVEHFPIVKSPVKLFTQA
jgi:hypothetical protein